MISKLNIHSPESKHFFIGESVRHSFAGGASLFNQMENTNEIWKDIQGFEGLYQVSNLGSIKTTSGYFIGERILKTSKSNKGYLRVVLYKNKVRTFLSVHKIVAMTFIPNAENKAQVNHKNLIKTDNRAENLEWVTQQENISHARKNNCYVGENNSRATITEKIASEIKQLLKEKKSILDISAIYAVSIHVVNNIKRGITWTHLIK